MGHSKTMYASGSRVAIRTLGVILSISLAACGTSNSTSKTQRFSPQAQSEAVEKDFVKEEVIETIPTIIGDTGSEAVKTTLINGLEKDIRSFKIRKASSSEWMELPNDKQQIKGKASVKLGVAPHDKDTDFDVAIQYADDTQIEVAGLRFGSMRHITFEIDNGVGYATFIDVGGKESTTKQQQPTSEETNATQEEATSQSPETPQDNVTYSSTYSGDNPEPSYQEYDYVEPTYDYSYSMPEPQRPVTPQQQVAPQQNTDGCLSDVALRYCLSVYKEK